MLGLADDKASSAGRISQRRCRRYPSCPYRLRATDWDIEASGSLWSSIALVQKGVCAHFLFARRIRRDCDAAADLHAPRCTDPISNCSSRASSFLDAYPPTGHADNRHKVCCCSRLSPSVIPIPFLLLCGAGSYRRLSTCLTSTRRPATWTFSSSNA